MKNEKKSIKISLGVLSFLIVSGLIIVFIIPKIYSNYLYISSTNEVTSYGDRYNNEVKLTKSKVFHDTKFGGIYVDITIYDFNKIGFNFGDSVDVEFSNGYKINDIPYYNGYYVAAGEPLLVGYPSDKYIKIGINYGEDLWKVAGITEKTSCTISLRESKKYIKAQETRNLQYSNVQGDMSDETFANFRPMNIGKLKKDFVYRGVSPIDNSKKRASTADKLISEKRIQYIIDLADSSKEIDAFSKNNDFNSPYFMSLYNDHKVSLLSMNVLYKTEDFSKKMIKGLRDMAKNEGAFYIHCLEGKDRTGYFCMIIGAIAGASYDELINDYMKSYDNYYGITMDGSREKYDLIKISNIDDMILYMTGLNDINKAKEADLSELATNYLIKLGMSRDEIDLLKSKIREN